MNNVLILIKHFYNGMGMFMLQIHMQIMHKKLTANVTQPFSIFYSFFGGRKTCLIILSSIVVQTLKVSSCKLKQFQIYLRSTFLDIYTCSYCLNVFVSHN